MPFGDRARLHRDDVPVDGALPDRIARLPRRLQQMRIAGLAVGIDEAHRDRLALARDLQQDLLAVEPDRAAALALHDAAAHLARDLPLALAEHVIDGGADRGNATCDLAFRHAHGKALREFLGDEAGREPAFAPARMVHQRRQERDVVADAVDVERVERGRLRLDRGRARRRMGDELGDHRIVMDRDLAALLHAGVVAHGDAVLARLPPAGDTSPAARSRAGSCGTGSSA